MTCHPLLTSPTTLSAGTRALSRNTSLKSVSPVISRNGRTVLPGDTRRRLGPHQLLVRDEVTPQRRPAPAVLARPVHRDPAAVVQAPLPVLQKRDARRQRTVIVQPFPLFAIRQVRAQPLLELGTGLFEGRGEGEVHCEDHRKGSERLWACGLVGGMRASSPQALKPPTLCQSF